MTYDSPPILNKRKIKISDEGSISGVSDDALRERVKELFDEERRKLSTNLFGRCKDYIDSQNGSRGERVEDSIMDEFYRFCKNKLPEDEKYKESIMFVSLFYYFLEKKRLLG